MKCTGKAFRRWLTLPSTIVAASLLVIGLLFVGVEAQSSNWVYYTGQHVTGTTEGGIVYYKVGGHAYTQNDTHVPQPADGTKVTVFYYADDPSAARVDQPVRWIEGVAMLIWFVAAGLVLLISAARRFRRARKRLPVPEDEPW